MIKESSLNRINDDIRKGYIDNGAKTGFYSFNKEDWQELIYITDSLGLNPSTKEINNLNYYHYYSSYFEKPKKCYRMRTAKEAAQFCFEKGYIPSKEYYKDRATKKSQDIYCYNCVFYASDAPEKWRAYDYKNNKMLTIPKVLFYN